MSVELEKYVASNWVNAEKRLATSLIEVANLIRRVQEMEKTQLSLVGQVKCLTDQRDLARSDLDSCQAANRDSQPRLYELYDAALKVELALRASRTTRAMDAHLERLRKAISGAAFDCGEIPF